MQNSAYDRIIQRLDYLISEGEAVKESKHFKEDYDAYFLKDDIYYKWKTSVLSFLKSVFGEASPHFQEFTENCQQQLLEDAIRGQAVLLAAKEDIEGGYLTSLENLVSADIFTDFLDMAKYLLGEGYKDPAASLIGAVLEDGLRKVARNNNVKIKTHEGIYDLTQKLVDAHIISGLNQSRIDVWREIRNSADHGDFEDYEKKDVKEMLTGVRDFLASCL